MLDIVEALYESGCEDIVEFTILNDGAVDGISELIKKQKNIKKLQLLSELRVDKEFLDNLPKQYLEVLEIDFSCQKELSYYSLSEFKNLKKLKCTVDVLNEQFMLGLTNCKNLKELEISINNIEDKHSDFTETLLEYFSQLLKLESLKIISYEYGKIDKVLKAVSLLKYLIHLDFDECKFSGMELNLLPQSLRNLRSLVLGSTNVTERELIEIINQSPKLERLEISGCENINYEFFEEANKIKNNRQDKHLLTLIVSRHDQIYALREEYNDLSLILIQESEPLEYLDPNEPLPVNDAKKMLDLYCKLFNIHQRHS